MYLLPDDPLLLAIGGVLTLLAFVVGGFIVAEILRLLRELFASPPKPPLPRTPPGDERLRRITREQPGEPVVREDRRSVSELIDRVEEED